MRHELSTKDKSTLCSQIAELREAQKTATGDQWEHLEYMLEERLDTLKAGFVDSFAVERMDY